MDRLHAVQTRQGGRVGGRAMNASSVRPTRVPTVENLGIDLLATTPRQRWMSLLRPFLGLAAYAAAAHSGLWWLTPVIVFAIFVAVVTVTHDVVHESLGLGPRETEVALFVMGAFLLESGHAYRTTHFQHHRVFPGPDDPEGEPARMTFVQSLLWGPFFLPKLWLWAFRRQRGRAAQRRWLVLEAMIPVITVCAGLALARTVPAIMAYAVMVIVGSWVYPLLTVHLPHKDYGDNPLNQSRTLRGRIIPAIFLELTYHLEHHLYPCIPSHHLAETSRRLTPFFEENGVRPWQVP